MTLHSFNKSAALVMIVAIVGLQFELPATAQSVAYAYDTQGRIISRTYPNGAVTTFTYDVSDNLVQVVTAPPPNQPPVAINDTVYTIASAPKSFDPRTNDSDPESGVLTITSVGTPTSGTAVITGAGTGITYTPSSNPSNPASFVYTIRDPQNATASAAVTVYMNLRPVASPDNVSTPHNTTVSFNPLTNDYDPESDDLTVLSVSSPSSGSASVSSGGQAITYTPASGFSGTATFTYVVGDSDENTATGNVSVAVAPLANQPPVAQNCTNYAMLDNSGDTYYYGQIYNVCAFDPDAGDTWQLDSVSGSPYAYILTSPGGYKTLKYAGPIGTGYVAISFTVRDALGAVSNTGQIDVYFVE